MAGDPGAFLIMQNDGNLVIYAPKAVWATNTEIANRVNPIQPPQPPKNCPRCVIP